MYAQFLICVILFIIFVWSVWKLIGKHIVEKIEKPKTPEEQREALKEKIITLKAYQKLMEDVEHEIEVTSELTKVKCEVDKAEKKLEKLDSVLENIGKNHQRKRRCTQQKLIKTGKYKKL